MMRLELRTMAGLWFPRSQKLWHPRALLEIGCLRMVWEGFAFGLGGGSTFLAGGGRILRAGAG